MWYMKHLLALLKIYSLMSGTTLKDVPADSNNTKGMTTVLQGAIPPCLLHGSGIAHSRATASSFELFQ